MVHAARWLVLMRVHVRKVDFHYNEHLGLMIISCILQCIEPRVQSFSLHFTRPLY